MYTYKTEILTVGTKWLSDKADANDIAMLDNLINERAADGWELVTYDYMATSMQIKGAFVVTFRKEKDDIFTQSSTNLFETLDVRYSITDKKELENSNGFGNYSIRAEEDNSYVISIGDCRFITIKCISCFTVHWNSKCQSLIPIHSTSCKYDMQFKY